MTGDEPLFAHPTIGVSVTRTDFGARFCESKGIETRVLRQRLQPISIILKLISPDGPFSRK